MSRSALRHPFSRKLLADQGEDGRLGHHQIALLLEADLHGCLPEEEGVVAHLRLNGEIRGSPEVICQGSSLRSVGAEIGVPGPVAITRPPCTAWLSTAVWGR